MCLAGRRLNRILVLAALACVPLGCPGIQGLGEPSAAVTAVKPGSASPAMAVQMTADRAVLNPDVGAYIEIDG